MGGHGEGQELHLFEDQGRVQGAGCRVQGARRWRGDCRVRGMTANRHPTTSAVIEAAIRVHRLLGPGLLESAYQECLAHELTKRGIPFRREVAVPLRYDDAVLDCGYRADLVVDGDLIVEVKSVERLAPIHTAQVLTQLRLTGARQALLINFGQLTLMAGLKSFLPNGNQLPSSQNTGFGLPDDPIARSPDRPIARSPDRGVVVDLRKALVLIFPMVPHGPPC